MTEEHGSAPRRPDRSYDGGAPTDVRLERAIRVRDDPISQQTRA